MPAGRGSLNGGATRAPADRSPAASSDQPLPNEPGDPWGAALHVAAFQYLLDAVDASDITALCGAIRELRRLGFGVVLGWASPWDELPDRSAPFARLLAAIDEGDEGGRDDALGRLQELGIEVTILMEAVCP